MFGVRSCLQNIEWARTIDIRNQCVCRLDMLACSPILAGVQKKISHFEKWERSINFHYFFPLKFGVRHLLLRLSKFVKMVLLCPHVVLGQKLSLTIRVCVVCLCRCAFVIMPAVWWTNFVRGTKPPACDLQGILVFLQHPTWVYYADNLIENSI